MSDNDLDADGDRRLRSPSVTANLPYLPRGPTANETDVLPERSSSPGIKRPASELEEGEDGRDSGREDQPQRGGSPLRSMYLPAGHRSHENGDVPMDHTASPMNEDQQDEGSLIQENDKLKHDRARTSRDEGRKPLNVATLVADYNKANRAASVSETSTVKLTPEQSDGTPEMQSTLSHDMPSVDEQIAKVTELSLQPLREGDRGYVVSGAWVERVKSRSSERAREKSPGKDVEQGEVGPIDNSALVAEESSEYRDLKDEAGESFVPLEPGLMIGEDFEIFPQDAWNLIVDWYGVAANSPVITRFVHNTNPEGEVGTENLQYELYPPLFTILKARADKGSDSYQEIEEGPVRVLASRSETFNHFLRRVKTIVGIPLSSKVRVWRIIGFPRQKNVSGVLTPAASRSTSPAPAAANASLDKFRMKLTINLDDFLDLEDGTQREMLEVQDQTGNENYNGHMSLSLAGLSQDETIVLEERVRGPSGGDWISEATKASRVDAGVAISITKNGNTAAQNKSNAKINSINGRQSPAPVASGMMTRGRMQRNGRSLGTCGLSNLGNTCYMNSAIQCVRSVEELTQYFRFGKYKDELNPSNPLSHNGDVARAYANLLDQMYAPSCPGSVAPRAFKNTIGRYGPSFSGYGQQDSQEFLGFLLDGLQEDLNRIQKKPYIEKPDSTDEMVSNPAALRALAEKCWDIYKARNDSVIVDLFAGTYKSTLVCPVCHKVSITFDPFNNLTLQLPIENVWSKDIFYFPLHDRPIRVSVELDKNGSIKALKEFVATRVGVEPPRLHVAEVYRNKFYKAYDDLDCASESIQQGDDVAVFELEAVPTNWPAPKKNTQKTRSMLFSYAQSEDEDETPGLESPMADKLLVPIFHRLPRESGTRFPVWSLAGVPTYMVLAREEACDYDSILRKVLAKIDTLTTYDLLQNESEESSVSSEVDDMVVTTSEDADSSAGTRMKNHSVDGEEDFVAVSMRDSGEDSNVDQSTVKPTRPQPSGGRTKKAKILEPGSFIPPELRTLFQMRVFRQSGELVPTGWNANLEDERNVTLIESRMPRTPSESPPSEVADRSYVPGDDASSESGDAQPDSINNNPFQLQPPDSDSESDRMPPLRELLSQKKKQTKKWAYRSAREGRRKGARMKHTYSKKGRRLVADSLQKPTDHGPLVQLGEGIILDWNPQAYETLFGGNQSTDGMRGSPTYNSIELLPDEELRQKRAQRTNRKKQGVSLDDCLDEFGKEEILSENDAWYCPRCKEFRRASKKFELWKAPDILVIHLKRFSSSRGLRDKLDILVDFPIEGLDLKDRVALKEESKSTIYDLFAVDNHYGGLGGGHYTAIARNFIDGNWYDYNDTMASKRSPQQAVTSAAYLLFYRRRSDRSLGGPYFEKIIDEVYRQKESPASSRASSLAGEDQRLDSSSRVGSSSALQGVGAGRQGPTDLTSGLTEINPDDEPPSYSKLYPNEGGLASNVQDTDNMDVDEGVDTSFSLDQVGGPFSENPSWGFDNPGSGIAPILTGPPASSDEDLMDGVSDKAADGSSAGNFSDQGVRMADFADDDTDGVLPGNSYSNSPNISGSPVAEIPIGPELDHGLHVKAPVIQGGGVGDDDDEDDDGPVAEVHIENEEGLIKSD